MRTLHHLLLSLTVLVVADSVMGMSPSFQVVATPENTLAVVNTLSGDTLHRITKPEGVIREMAALDNGQVVMTTKANVSEFWNSATGELLRRYDERIYAFNSSQSLCVTFNREHDLILLNYPELTQGFILLRSGAWGPSALLFSPDDRYLAVEFCNHYPLSDDVFLDPVFDSTVYRTLLFDIQTGQQAPDVGGAMMGRFSEDSRIYITDDERQYDLAGQTWLSTPRR